MHEDLTAPLSTMEPASDKSEDTDPAAPEVESPQEEEEVKE